MRLKNQKNRNKSAYWRGEKVWIYLRRGILVVSLIIIVSVILFGIKLSGRVFPLKNIIVTGNNSLEEGEIKDAIETERGRGLIRVSLRGVNKKLMDMPWIKKVSLRKQFPDTLIVRVEETVPRAILSFDGGLFLLDGRGYILEEIKEEKTPFLPVITGINYNNNKADIIEALKLVEALSQKGILSHKESIEITLKSYGLYMNIDGEIFKIGYGRYADKIERWKDLEVEVRKKGIVIEYVDLRFIDRVIVKPLKAWGKGSRSQGVK